MSLPSAKTIKVLFARSGNRCAYPGCLCPLVEGNDCVIGELCHIKALHQGGPRYDQSQTDAERNAAENLMLMCGRHHKIVDDDPQSYPVHILIALKREIEGSEGIEVTPSIGRRALLLREHSIRVQGDLRIDMIQAHTVTIKASRQARPKILLSPDVIGGSPNHRAYLKYLIDRYQEFAKRQTDRIFKFSAVYASIKNRFKATWEHIPISRFEEVVQFSTRRLTARLLVAFRKVNRSLPMSSLTVSSGITVDMKCEVWC